ncbi:stress-induced protein [Dyella sp.]|uniref:stress-induced protein n=1 Tax=Dyella sp. TaxID=1869338 RepID=UPI002ED18CFB
MNEREEIASKPLRGFARLSPEQRAQIARRGGLAAHASGHAHEFDTREARLAGHKGGEAVSANRQHMAEIGRKGGKGRRKKIQEN